MYATKSTNGILMGDNSINSTQFNIINNTIILNGTPGNTIRIFDNNLNLYNNASYAPSSMSGTFLDTGTVGTFNTDYNFLYQWDDASAAEVGTNGSTAVDPLFTDINNEEFTLSSSSTLIGNADETVGAAYQYGINPSATWPLDLTTDLVDRTAQSAWDSGAYQTLTTSSNILSSPAASILQL